MALSRWKYHEEIVLTAWGKNKTHILTLNKEQWFSQFTFIFKKKLH